MTNDLDNAFGPSPECPDLEALATWRDKQEQEDKAMQSHIADCAYCQSELALLEQELGAAPDPSEMQDVAWIVAALKENPPLGQAAKPQGWFDRVAEYWRVQPMAALSWAGAMVCLLLAAGLTLRDNAGLGPIPGTETGTTVYRSTQLELEGPLGDVDVAPEMFSWSASEQAVSYRVRLMEVDGSVLWEGISDAPSLELPADVAAIAVPGKTLLWQVQALDAQGNEVAESARGSFRVPVAGLQ